jgi:halogenation protein CepH
MVNRGVAPRRQHYDVIVIGGGPAGSTLATLVAQQGHQVLLLERARFPRYRVGESLWIATSDILDATGVGEAVKQAGFASKSGGTFLWGPPEQPWSLYFTDVNGCVSNSYHVDRASFDALLLQRAEQAGVEVLLESAVLNVLWDSGRAVGVKSSIAQQTRSIDASYVVDASGLRSRHGADALPAQSPPRYESLSVWAYFRDVNKLPSPDESNVLTAMFHEGWCWMIPLADGLTSIGVVLDVSALQGAGRGTRLEELFSKSFASCPFVSQRLKNATRCSEYRSCLYHPRNLSRYHAPGLLMVGDAACFVDPVLSTGVHLGMSGACYGAFALNTLLDGGHEPLAMEAFERLYRRDHATYQSDTDELYAMNAGQSGQFWQRRKPASFTVQQQQMQQEALDFRMRIATHHGDMDTISQLQAKRMRRLSEQRGLGRFSAPAFLRHRLRACDPGRKPAEGYVMGDAGEGQFRKSLVAISSSDQFAEVSSGDSTIFELCDGNRTVAQVIDGLVAHYNLADVDPLDLAQTVGQWVELGWLERVE